MKPPTFQHRRANYDSRGSHIYDPSGLTRRVGESAAANTRDSCGRQFNRQPPTIFRSLPDSTANEEEAWQRNWSPKLLRTGKRKRSSLAGLACLPLG